MVAIFFDLDLVFTGIEVEGVVGGSGEPTIDIDLGGGGETIGREESCAFDNACGAEAITLGIADHEISTNQNEEDSGKEDEGAVNMIATFHDTII